MLKIISLGPLGEIKLLAEWDPWEIMEQRGQLPEPTRQQWKAPPSVGDRLDQSTPLALGWTQTLDFSPTLSFVRSGSEKRAGEKVREVCVCSLPPLILPKDHIYPSNFFFPQIQYHLLLWLISGQERKIILKVQEKHKPAHLWVFFSSSLPLND